MSSAETAPSPVLLDTDVFSWVYVLGARNSPEGDKWRAVLAGRTVTISVQTEVELRAWPLLRDWGAKRTEALERLVADARTIQVTPVVQASFVDLTVWAKQNGHAIQDKVHTGDRWIAATALAYGLELAAGDGIYNGIADLRRLQ